MRELIHCEGRNDDDEDDEAESISEQRKRVEGERE